MYIMLLIIHRAYLKKIIYQSITIIGLIQIIISKAIRTLKKAIILWSNYSILRLKSYICYYIIYRIKLYQYFYIRCYAIFWLIKNWIVKLT